MTHRRVIKCYCCSLSFDIALVMAHSLRRPAHRRHAPGRVVRRCSVLRPHLVKNRVHVGELRPVVGVDGRRPHDPLPAHAGKQPVDGLLVAPEHCGDLRLRARLVLVALNELDDARLGGREPDRAARGHPDALGARRPPRATLSSRRALPLALIPLRRRGREGPAGAIVRERRPPPTALFSPLRAPSSASLPLEASCAQQRP